MKIVSSHQRQFLEFSQDQAAQHGRESCQRGAGKSQHFIGFQNTLLAPKMHKIKSVPYYGPLKMSLSKNWSFVEIKEHLGGSAVKVFSQWNRKESASSCDGREKS